MGVIVDKEKVCDMSMGSDICMCYESREERERERENEPVSNVRTRL